MNRLILTFLLLLSGCQSYVDAELGLVQQAQKGLDLCRAEQSERAQLSAALQNLQRQRLDAAFDADVREQSTLSPEWVVEHRRAYAVALDAFALQRLAAERTADMNSRNLAATQAIVDRLRALIQVQQRFIVDSPSP